MAIKNNNRETACQQEKRNFATVKGNSTQVD